DDVEMKVTHVVRGDDHISNTPKHVLLFRALGAPLPAFAHVPLILGPDKKRLSKRHGATSVMEYARQGYVPEAMVNFLALLDWSPADLAQFDAASIEAALRALADARGVKAAALIHAARVAVTGKAASPGLFEVLALVGRDRTRARLQSAARLVAGAGR